MCCFSAYAETSSENIVSHLSSLNEKQKNVLYEFEVLKRNGCKTDQFWKENKNQFSELDAKTRDELAQQIFENSTVVYKPQKNSAVQIWMQTQLFTNWMFYLSAFIAICAVIALFKKYWSLLIGFLLKRLEPLLRYLFSPLLLTCELLALGIACVFYAVTIEDFVLRTVIIHLGLFLLWSQSTALFTKEYWVKKYIFEIESNFWGKDPWETIKTICLPAVLVTLALSYVLYKVPADIFYNYEIVISGIAFVYALPFWRFVEKYIYPVLFPFKNEGYRARSINSLGACTVIALILTVVLILQGNAVFYNVIAAFISLEIFSFLILSSKENHKYNLGNYYYLQFVIVLFLVLTFLYSYQIHSNEIIWFSLIGSCFFIILKYLEIFSFFSSWKRGNSWAWKLLGLAALLWVLGKGILLVSKQFFTV
ncbi:hypothetical protein HYN56_08010 [Flavobacterium crocinum]|uniref:Uncharacterized protein n=1 Tax=Flavobacterium crocinum TaxID=2183896 RepID=A0A2S1YJD1_9FLAO|nr:hypothetical protein HYN56_08010 [Flavobacterium crocinum]